MAMAMKAVRAMVADMFRCPDCGKPKVEMAADWKGRGTGRSGESVHLATRFGGDTCDCLHRHVVKVALEDHCELRTETSNCWACRNCGAAVDEMISTCLLCGYERKECTSCRGTGVIDSGPHPIGIAAEPCHNCDEGYYYPPVERTTTPGAAFVESALFPDDANDCAACGDRPAVRDEEGNFTYPRYTHQGKPPVGVCGGCEREGIPV